MEIAEKMMLIAGINIIIIYIVGRIQNIYPKIVKCIKELSYYALFIALIAPLGMLVYSLIYTPLSLIEYNNLETMFLLAFACGNIGVFPLLFNEKKSNN
ncbi:hypothetical protein [Vallitalea guaymasensis]|uniref:hypothetical protein n=1 Tax=Vallitalea guaymasensis TaxID=1185412 RepID=UPI000DE41EBE|nr:hypothetical protein [Vallitalea guaymasensis]